MFINYDVSRGLSINTYRHASGYANSDVGGLVEDISQGHNSSCPLSGALDALQDGAAWAGTNATTELLEELHNLITSEASHERYSETRT